ncbi:MAG: pyridoxamine 5'-phosphate oxidase family protein [Rikenellaceae bacterium]|nr:pyridoxamine 5'-phosphate oxidase family protein [Rikenellaceae bacterium]
MDERIGRFLSKHHVATLATVAEDGSPYCCNIFYAYDADNDTLVFSSDIKTAHAGHFTTDARVAASVVLESKAVGTLRGTQMTGRIIRPEVDELDKARKRYLKRFPYAAVMSLELWIMRIDSVKHTDNRLGFGVKLKWTRKEL